jgi:hypothetical protein
MIQNADLEEGEPQRQHGSNGGAYFITSATQRGHAKKLLMSQRTFEFMSKKQIKKLEFLLEKACARI